MSKEVRIVVKWDKEAKKYKCVFSNNIYFVFNGQYMFEIETPRNYVIQLSNFPECESIQDAIQCGTLQKIFQIKCDNSFRENGWSQLIWGILTSMSTNNYTIETIKYYHPITRKWAFTYFWRLTELFQALELDFINYALEYDLKQFPLIQFKHSIDRELVKSELESIADEIPKKS